MVIAHPPGRHALGVGALAAAQDLGGHAEQAQAFAGPLDGALGEAGGALQLFVGGARVAPGGHVSGTSQRGRDHDQRSLGDAPRRHLRSDLGVAQVVGHRDSHVRPVRATTRPAGHPRVGVVLELEVDEHARRRKITTA